MASVAPKKRKRPLPVTFQKLVVPLVGNIQGHIRVLNDPDSGPRAEVKKGEDGKYVKIDDPVQFRKTMIVGPNYKFKFKKAFQNAEEKWNVFIGEAPLILVLSEYKAFIETKNGGMEEVEFRLVAPIDKFQNPVRFQYYSPRTRNWMELKGNPQSHFPKKIWQEYILPNIHLIGERRAKSLARLHPYFHYARGDKDHLFGVHFDGKNEKCVTTLMNPLGAFENFNFVHHRLPFSVDLRPLDVAQKRCMKTVLERYKRITNLTNESYETIKRKKQLPDLKLMTTDHPYICPPRNDPKACLFDEKKKQCVRPPTLTRTPNTCRKIRHMLQNRSKNIKFLLEHVSRRNCNLFFAAANAAGSSVNSRKLMDEVRKRYAPRLADRYTFLDPQNPPCETNEDLLILFEEVDNVFFDGSLRTSELKLPKLRVRFIKNDDAGLYEEKKNRLSINVRGISKRVKEKPFSYNYDGKVFRNRFEAILGTLMHEIAHYLADAVFDCPDKTSDGHGFGWAAFYKYFFGGGGEKIERWRPAFTRGTFEEEMEPFIASGQEDIGIATIVR